MENTSITTETKKHVKKKIKIKNTKNKGTGASSIPSEKKTLNLSSLKQRIDWALTPPPKIKKNKTESVAKQKKIATEKEKKWGNEMIGQSDNGQWTTLLGENLVRDVLLLRGENPRRPERKNGYNPDWETDEAMYEVKTRNWNVNGTAGEKVLGTWIKYKDIPDIYGKPLRIVCVAYQEEELTNGKTKYFGSNIDKKIRLLLDLAKSWHIEYIPFSELVSNINYK
jgi:hypothetical protein